MCGQGSVDRRDAEPDDAIGRCLVEASRSDNWQDFLVRLAHGVRRVALNQSELFPQAPHPPQAPWVPPSLRSLRWTETFLNTILSYGFDDEAAVAAYRTYTTFLFGQLLLEVAARAPHDTAAVHEPATVPARDLSDYPNLRRLQPMLSQDHSAAEFEDALEALIDRLEGWLAHRPRRARVSPTDTM